MGGGPADNTYYLAVLGSPPSDFDITETDGVVQQIRYELTGTDDNPVSSFYLADHMNVLNLAVKSYVCAQKGISIFSQFSVLETDPAAYIGGFSYTYAGVTVTCVTDYVGYEKAREDLLMPVENGTPYFHLTFTMEKTD